MIFTVQSIKTNFIWFASGTGTHVGGAWSCLWGTDWMVVVCYWL